MYQIGRYKSTGAICKLGKGGAGFLLSFFCNSFDGLMIL